MEDFMTLAQDESNVWDTRLKLFSSYFVEVNRILIKISNKNESVNNDVTQVQLILNKVKEHILDLVNATKSSTEVNYLRSDQLDQQWSLLGEGNFGKVFRTKLSGAKVAVKVFKDQAKSIFRESNLLRFLSHDNIVAFRGIGYVRSSEVTEFTNKQDNRHQMSRVSEDCDRSDKEEMFLVMEYVEQNLYHYVQSLDSYERHGLSAFHTWSIGQQIVSALNFLHRNGIAHRDLKPDNVLVETGPNTIKAKVADFGLAWHAEQINISCATAIKLSGLSSSSVKNSSSGVNIRWGPPEFFTESESDDVERKYSTRTLSFEDYKRGDVYCFGLVLAYTLTGQKPFDHLTTSTLEWWREQPLSPSYSFLAKLRGPLPDVIVSCIQDCPIHRPSIETLLDTFLQNASPYENATDEAEFFSCGFLRKTNIFIADTCTTNIETGCYQTGIRPTGYDHKDLICELDRNNFPYKFFPDTWDVEDDQKYLEFYQNFKGKANKGEIENNPKAALKELILLREGDEEDQRLQMRFKETEYCHQQAMRFVWRSLTEEERSFTVPCKTDVNNCFSNTFGLQVCVLTHEGDGETQKFMFPQRANRTGIPTPGAYTGGAVEGSSVLDYTPNGKYYDLVQTAMRGLKEELSIELSTQEREVLCITTLYLAFDNYEWGMCGFLDLSDPRLSENNRVSAAVLQDRFVSGPKDKFEHSKVKFVPFTVEDMVQFLYENHDNVASYAKAAVVKVLQAYFGWKRVEQAFGQKFPKT